MVHDSRSSSETVNRRSFLTKAAATSVNLFALSYVLPSDAKVDIDIERFGDKGGIIVAPIKNTSYFF